MPHPVRAALFCEFQVVIFKIQSILQRNSKPRMPSDSKIHHLI